MVRHRVEGGARAAAVALFGRDVLWPDAALARMALGRYVADFALEGEEVDDAEGKIPEHEACEEGALVELRVYPAPDAAESSDDEYHGLGQGKREIKKRRKGKRTSLDVGGNYISASRCQWEEGKLLHLVQPAWFLSGATFVIHFRRV